MMIGEAGFDSLFHSVQTDSETHPTPIQWASGDLSHGKPERGADHFPPSTAEVKNKDLCLNSQYVFVAYCLIKHRHLYLGLHDIF
jgi:hypothetical protein